MRVQKLFAAGSGAFVTDDGREIETPHLVLVFGPTDALKSTPSLQWLAERFPQATIVGCSTGTSVSGRRLSDGEISAAAIRFSHTRVRLSVRELMGASQSAEAGRLAGADLAAPDLAAVLVLSDGLNVNGTALVEGMKQACGEGVSISGGLAGDGPRFGETVVVVGGRVFSNIVAAVGLYGDAVRVGCGSAGGWDQFGPLRRITRSEGSVLHELDGSPALDLYERYLGEEAAQLPASALHYPLMVWDPARPGDAVVRTVLGVDRAARTMTFAGDIPEGWHARLMRGAADHLIAAGSEAAEQAGASLARTGRPGLGHSPVLTFYVSCVGRRLVLGQKTEDELDAVADMLGPGAVISGFYSYGEIAPNNRTGVSGLHNQTLTLTLLAEAA